MRAGGVPYLLGDHPSVLHPRDNERIPGSVLVPLLLDINHLARMNKTDVLVIDIGTMRY